MHALLGQARRRLWAVRNLSGLRCQREGLVQRVPGQKLIGGQGRCVAHVYGAAVALLASHSSEERGRRRQVAARIRQAEELTTPAAPGNGPGSTANGKSLGGRIIARGLAGAKVDKPDFETKFFLSPKH